MGRLISTPVAAAGADASQNAADPGSWSLPDRDNVSEDTDTASAAGQSYAEQQGLVVVERRRADSLQLRLPSGDSRTPHDHTSRTYYTSASNIPVDVDNFCTATASLSTRSKIHHGAGNMRNPASCLSCRRVAQTGSFLAKP